MRLHTGHTRARTWDPLDLSWADFTARLRSPSAGSKESVGGYVFGQLTDHQRSAGSVVARDALTLDYDNLDLSSAERLLDGELEFIAAIHTTASHTLECPRIRVIIPLASPIPASAYPDAVRAAEAVIGAAPRDVSRPAMDAGSTQPERFMYWPVASKDYRVAESDELETKPFFTLDPPDLDLLDVDLLDVDLLDLDLLNREYPGERASRGEVRERVQALADELADCVAGANDLAAALAPRVGDYVAAGQIERAEALGILLGALDGWSYDADGDEGRMRATIERRLDHGISSGAREWKRNASRAVADPETVPTMARPWDLEDASCYHEVDTLEDESPSILAVGGSHVFYSACTHLVFGRTNSAKTWVALAAAASILRGGGRVLVVDLESTQLKTAKRLRQLGVSIDQLLAGLHYTRTTGPGKGRRFEALLATRYDLILIDSATAVIGTAGIKGENLANSAEAVRSWNLAVPQRLAETTGAAVVIIAHAAKGAVDNMALGSQDWIASLTGAAYRADIVDAATQHKDGRYKLTVSKDRPGGLPAGVGSAIADVHLSAGDGVGKVRLAPPVAPETPEEVSKEDQHAMLLAKVWSAVDQNPGIGKRALRVKVGGRAPSVDGAVAELIALGCLYAGEGPGGSKPMHTVKPYPCEDAS